MCKNKKKLTNKKNLIYIKTNRKLTTPLRQRQKLYYNPEKKIFLCSENVTAVILSSHPAYLHFNIYFL